MKVKKDNTWLMNFLFFFEVPSHTLGDGRKNVNYTFN